MRSTALDHDDGRVESMRSRVLSFRPNRSGDDDDRNFLIGSAIALALVRTLCLASMRVRVLVCTRSAFSVRRKHVALS